MSQFATIIQDLHDESNGFEKLRKHLSDELIEELCQHHGIHGERRRRLPIVTTVWLVVGMALFRRESIQQVAKTLNLFDGLPPRSSSITDARKRLGPDALRWLFQKLGLQWCDAFRAEKWKGLTTYGIDGTTITLEDTKENVKEFGKAGSRPDKSPAARPQARAVGLMELSTKMVIDAEIVPLATGENNALKPLLDRLPDNGLFILDRGFQSRSNFRGIYSADKNRHFVCRMKRNFKPKWIENLTPASWLAEIEFTQAERTQDPNLPACMPVRVIEYKIKGYKDVIRIATSLLDENKYPAHELAKLYYRRWEFELGLRDLKVTLLDSRGNIRSKKPQGVRQELWAIFLAYNLVRHEAAVVATQHGVSPRCLSFKTALISVGNFFRVFASGYADPAAIPDAVCDMRQWMWYKRLPERKPERICPRWVKDKQPSKYPKKPSTWLGV